MLSRRASVRIPKTGRIITLREAREALRAREVWLGQPMGVLKKRLRAQDEDFKALMDVVDRHNAGGTYEEAAKAGGVSLKTAKDWIGGKRLPRRVSPKWSESMLAKRKELRITPERATPFAYVLGAMMGDVYRYRQGAERKYTGLNLWVTDEGFARTFSKKLSEATGMTKDVKRSRGDFLVNIGSRNIIQLFNELTNYGKTVPRGFANPKSPMKAALEASGSVTKFLATPEERLEFVRAIYDSIGSAKKGPNSRNASIIVRPKRPDVVSLVRSVLIEKGMNPWMTKSGFVVIPTSEADVFMREIGFRKNMKNLAGPKAQGQ